MLLDGICDYLPSPIDRGDTIATTKNGETISLPPDPNGPLAALVFKVMADTYSGILSFVRVYSGTLEKGSYVLDATTDEKQILQGYYVFMRIKERILIILEQVI